jgi:hypothetical protein
MANKFQVADAVGDPHLQMSSAKRLLRELAERRGQ